MRPNVAAKTVGPGWLAPPDVAANCWLGRNGQSSLIPAGGAEIGGFWISPVKIEDMQNRAKTLMNVDMPIGRQWFRSRWRICKFGQQWFLSRWLICKIGNGFVQQGLRSRMPCTPFSVVPAPPNTPQTNPKSSRLQRVDRHFRPSRQFAAKSGGAGGDYGCTRCLPQGSAGLPANVWPQVPFLVPCVTQERFRAGDRASGPDFGRILVGKTSKVVLPIRIWLFSAPWTDFRPASTIA